MAQYFLYDPQGSTQIFDTAEKLQSAMDEYDFLGNYCDDGWSEEVENVIAGFIPDGIKRVDDLDDDNWQDEDDFYQEYATHQATQCDLTDRPDDVGEDGRSESTGDYWGEWDHKCGYAFQTIAKVKGE